MSENLPAASLPDDIVDLVAREVALEVKEHIEAMYPKAAEAVAWDSAARSIQGVVRNTMNSAGKAAERGTINQWLRNTRSNRRRAKASRRAITARIEEKEDD